MANIQASLKGWSTTEASNQPDSTDATTLVGDLRAIQAGIRYYFSQDTIASAATTDLGSKEAGYLSISGTTTITAFGTVSAGIRKYIKFDGALTLTHNGTSLILPGAANITTAAGDVALMESLGSGNWRCLFYSKASGQPVTSPLSDSFVNELTSVTIDASVDYVMLADGSDGGKNKKGLLPDASTTHKGVIRNSTAAEFNTGTDDTSVPTTKIIRENFWRKIIPASLTGAAVEFTGIPEWATLIVVNINGLSTNGTGHPLLQLGDAGGYEVAGYSGYYSRIGGSGGASTSLSSGILLNNGWAATYHLFGHILLTRIPGTYTWTFSGETNLDVNDSGGVVAGSKTLSETLNSLRIYINGTQLVDEGTFVAYVS
jgi:hypothetical protein